MSRHRTTLKMHRARDKEEPSQSAKTDEKPAEKPAAGVLEQTAIDCAPASPAPSSGMTAEPETKSDVVSRESFNRFLAVEAEEREASEERTSTILARYFKLTLAMACLNMVVAGVSVALLFSFSTSLKTVVVTAAAAPVVAVPTPAPAPPQVAPAPAPPVETDAVAPVAAPAPAKMHLLGEPLPAAPKRAVATPLVRTPRPAVKPASAKPRMIATDADDESPTLASRATERW
jgi:hypothetical protein